MKKYIIFTIMALWFMGAQAQTEWTFGEDIVGSNGNGYWVSDADSVFFDDDTLYIAGAETMEVYINIGKTRGHLRLVGTVQSKDTLGYSSTDDDIHFYCSRHKGDGNTKNSNISETFYAIDSVEQSAGSVGAFDVYPLSNTTLDDEQTAFYTFRIYGIANQVSAVWLKEERINQY